MPEVGGPVRRLWESAGLCNRSFGHTSLIRRLLMFAVMVTATRRIQRPHAVATLNSADALSIVAWGSWLVITLLTLLASLLLVVTLPIAVVLVPVVLCLYVLTISGVVQRLSAGRRSGGLDRALHLTNVAAEPAGHGHGSSLLSDVIDVANGVGRPITLAVKVDNDKAIALYRRYGFQETGRVRRELYMSRPSDTQEPDLVTAAPWSAPIPPSVGVIFGTAAGTAIGVVLTIAYWSTPAAWLMLPASAAAGLAAACDARWLRMPNRLLAAAFASLALIVTILSIAVDPMIVAVASAGVATFAGPLLVLHLASPATTGLGDAKLAASLGAVCGVVHPFAALVALIVSLLFGAVYGTVRRSRRPGGFPLGPSLAVGAAVTLALWQLTGGPTTW